jgi:hypothetical protein
MRLPKPRKRKDGTLFIPQAVNGLSVEDNEGVPIILDVTRVLKPQIQVGLLIQPLNRHRFTNRVGLGEHRGRRYQNVQ